MKTYTFKRPFATPSEGFIPAKSADEAFSLLLFAHGDKYWNACLWCAETNQRFRYQVKTKKAIEVADWSENVNP